AIDPDRFSLPPREGWDGPLRGCFIGRLVPYKGADMLIEAAAPLMREGRLELDFIGDGPMMEELKAQAAREGVGDAITWRGWVAHDQLQNVARESHLFTFPSVREFGGAVVLEAMTLGVVPVIVDYGGPGEHVIEGTGYKLPIGPRSEIISGLRAQLTRIADDPQALAAVSRAAYERVQRKYTWAAKAAQTHQVYEWILGRRAEKPDPFIDM
ncbi:MAG: glycosyltransferase family 4 protein, partial [Pseudomonadota bacterium]